VNRLLGLSLFVVCVLSGCGQVAASGNSLAANASNRRVKLQVSTSSLPTGTVGASYSAQLGVSGGTAPYTWSLTSGTLPPGLFLNSSTGAITGTPTAAVSASLTFTAKDSSRPPQTGSATLALGIDPASLTIGTNSLPSGQVGSNYGATLTASGGTAPYTWSLTSGALPTGLSLNSSTGAITGTPTVAVDSTTLTFTATDSASPAQSKSAVLTLTIVPSALAITTSSLPGGQAGTPYNATLVASGGTAPYSWSISSGTLPAGIALSSSGGLSGTPATQGTSTVTFQVTDSSSIQQTATKSLSVQVDPGSSGSQSTFYGPGINADALNNVRVGPIPAVSYRFVSNHTGTLSQIRFYLIVNASKSGYNAGTGGTLLIQLETDDGSTSHNPSGLVLGSATIPNPSVTFPAVVLSPAPHLTAGNLYHVVFTNIDADPTANYVSVDDLYMAHPSTPMQPAFPDANWAALIYYNSAWSVYRYNTPILEADFADGASLGCGYMEVWVGVPEPASGSAAVREQFTVSGANTAVSSVSIRVARVSGSDPLTVRLEQADGNVVEEGTIPASAVPLSSSSSPSYVWATYTFSAMRTLLAGQAYHLVLQAPASSVYQSYPIRKGTGYQFKPSTFFPDGYAQFTTDGSSWAGWTQWGVSNRTDSDLQFYFTVVP
jgi:Putative Ig domain